MSNKANLNRKRTAVGDGLRIATLYSYNGSSFEGLERLPEVQTIEGSLLTAIATVVGEKRPDDRVSLVNISRAITTDPGVHAARQVLSLEIGNIPAKNVDEIPDIAEVRKHLPAEILVYDIIPLDVAFSARRMCDSKTYEILIPTYVFLPPPEETGYRFAPTIENNGSLYQYDPEETSLRRQASIKRTKSTRTIAKVKGAQSVMTAPSKRSIGTNMATPIKSSFNDFDEESKKPKFWKKIVNCFKKKKQPVEQEFIDDAATVINTVDNSPNLSRNPSVREVYDVGACVPSPTPSINLSQSIGNSASTPLGDDYKLSLKGFRISDDQLNTLKHILAIFNGTHNWHNYNESGSYEDQKSYMRILGLEMSIPEIHADGMEWLRIKIRSSSSFGKQQVQKMIGMAIMVVRTNTTRSVVANSFGYSSINIPAAPSRFVVLDYVQYDNYNSDAKRRGSDRIVDFRKYSDEITAFRHDMIHDKIYEHEAKHFEFAEWLHNIDSNSQMYHHFLNERGVITPVTQNTVEEESKLDYNKTVITA